LFGFTAQLFPRESTFVAAIVFLAAAGLLTLETPPTLSIHPDYSSFHVRQGVVWSFSCHILLSAGTGAKSKFSSSTVNTSLSEETLKSGLTSSGKESCGPYRPVSSSKQVKVPALFPQTTCKVFKWQVSK